MKSETYLHPNDETRYALLRRMYDHASDIDFNQHNWATLNVTGQNRLAEDMVQYVLSQIKTIHILETVVTNLEIQGLVAYLNSHQGQLSYTFLDEAYRIYNQAIKREIVEASRLPLVAAGLWEINALVTIAKDQIRDIYS